MYQVVEIYRRVFNFEGDQINLRFSGSEESIERCNDSGDS